MIGADPVFFTTMKQTARTKAKNAKVATDFRTTQLLQIIFLHQMIYHDYLELMPTF